MIILLNNNIPNLNKLINYQIIIDIIHVNILMIKRTPRHSNINSNEK